jgi:hypothetical protein
MKKTIHKILGVIAGLAIAGGALVGWHFFELDSWFAIMIGFGGLALVGKSLDFDFDWF